MNRFLIIGLILMLAFARKAKCDHIILNGDTSWLYLKSPLEQHPEFKLILSTLTGYEANCYDCFCNKYDAEWTVINNELYLLNINSCPENNKHLKADMSSLFVVHNGKVKADWVTDTLWAPKGKSIYSADMMPIYEMETRVVVLNGKVTSIKKFDYPVTKEPLYNRREDSLRMFIYSHINWEKIPNLYTNQERVILNFQTSETGGPKNIRILRSSNDTLYENETKRVIGLLSWGVYFHGKILSESWLMPVIFSEDNRKKYKPFSH